MKRDPEVRGIVPAGADDKIFSPGVDIPRLYEFDREEELPKKKHTTYEK